MTDVNYREDITVPRTLNEYLEALELRESGCTVSGHGIIGVNKPRAGLGDWERHLSTNGNGSNNLSESLANTAHAKKVGKKMQLPTGIKHRTRVARGGRLYVDRLPLYDDDDDDGDDEYERSGSGNYDTFNAPMKKVKYIYPTYLPPAQKRLTALGTELFPQLHAGPGALPTGSGGANSVLAATSSASHASKMGSVGGNAAASVGKKLDSTDASSAAAAAASLAAYGPAPPSIGHYVHRLPAVLPLSRAPMPPALLKREAELFACSDSEDERVDVPRRGISSKVMPLPSSAHCIRETVSEYVTPKEKAELAATTKYFVKVR
jgi:hypothetical protein